jgi:hypothetical protein
MIHVGNEREERWPAGSSSLAVVLVLLLAWAMAIAWHERHMRAQLRALPPATRSALYADTIDQLRRVCPTHPGLLDHCVHEAELVVQLPECDADCRALAATFLERTSR